MALRRLYISNDLSLPENSLRSALTPVKNILLSKRISIGSSGYMKMNLNGSSSSLSSPVSDPNSWLHVSAPRMVGTNVVVKKSRLKRKPMKCVIKLYENEEERSMASAIVLVTTSSTETTTTVKKKLRGRPVKLGKEAAQYWLHRPSESTWWRATVITVFLSAKEGSRPEMQIREHSGTVRILARRCACMSSFTLSTE